MPSTGINGNRNSPHVQDIQYGQQTQKNFKNTYMFIVRLCTCAFSKPLRENKITKMSKGILVQQTKNPRNKMKHFRITCNA